MLTYIHIYIYIHTYIGGLTPSSLSYSLLMLAFSKDGQGKVVLRLLHKMRQTYNNNNNNMKPDLDIMCSIISNLIKPTNNNKQ